MSSSARTFRTLFVLLTLALFAIAAVVLVRYGSTPTDENIFTEPPSPVYLGASLVGTPVGKDSPAGTGPALHAGDLILSVGSTEVWSLAQYTSALKNATGNVRVTVARQTPKNTRTAEVDADALRTAPVRDVRRSALVIEVAKDGASDRAGMRVGDVILRLNGQRFSNVMEADAFLRSGTVGHSTDYEILRANETLTLRVTLAKFGLRLSVIVFWLAGISFIVFGAFLGVARPAIVSARCYGLAFVLLGYVISVLQLGRALDPGVVPRIRELTIVPGLFFGMATLMHASMYFPRARSSVLARRWVLPVAYGMASVASVIVFFTPARPLTVPMIGVMALFMGVVAWLGRRDMTPDMRQITRPIKITTTVVTVAVAIALSFPKRWPGFEPGYAGLALVLVPLVYLWTIGRYRLLDLDLRVRRHVQYSLASTAWGLVPLGLLLWLIVVLPHWRLPLPNVKVQGTAVEVMNTPMESPQRAVVEKTVLMLVAVGLALGLRAVAISGQRWIANKFYRADHDYRRAAREMSRLVTARPDLDGLSAGLVDVVTKLLQVKRAGVAFFHEGRTFFGTTPHGFAPDQWERVAAASEDLHEGVRRATTEANAEYAFPRLRRLLRDVDVHFLYPLRSHDELVGTLLIGEKLAEDAFRDDDFEFLAALATQVAPAVENAFLYNELAEQERLKHELEIARRIQLESLPQFTPRIQGLDISGVSIPAFEVGGDYFDYLNGDERHLTVMVGDVSGKGTSAALYMSKLQGILRSLHAFDLPPHELFVRTNALLCRDLERRSFVTALGGFFDTERRQLVLARAGHLPLYYRSVADGHVQRILPRGLGFGLSAQQLFARELEERTLAYQPGDVFVFVTDGITECLAPSGDDFGEERLMALLEQCEDGAARDIRDRVTAAVRAFASTAEQFDDQTVVVVKATA